MVGGTGETLGDVGSGVARRCVAIVAALQRQPSAQRRGQPLGARAERREHAPAAVVHGGARRPARLLGAAETLLGGPASIAGHGAAHVASGVEHAEGLDVAGALVQAAVLVEVAAHELERAVVVRVQDRGGRAGRP